MIDSHMDQHMAHQHLITETRAALTLAGYTTGEVSWVGLRDGTSACDWAQFVEQHGDVRYDDGFGTCYIRLDLVVVLCDGSWLEREEYDGAERWAHRRAPRLPRSPGAFSIWNDDA